MDAAPAADLLCDELERRSIASRMRLGNGRRDVKRWHGWHVNRASSQMRGPVYPA